MEQREVTLAFIPETGKVTGIKNNHEYYYTQNKSNNGQRAWS